VIQGPYDLNGREDAAKYIAQQVEEMSKLYQNIIEVADHFDLRVDQMLPWPADLYRLGHNDSMQAQVYWNPSSKYC
jgi:uncharacterized UPF0160 family protein